MAITASRAKADLTSLIERVNSDRTAIEIVSKKGNAVLISFAEYEALEETAYLLRTPANAARSLQRVAQHRAGAAAGRMMVE
ncbi:type II toxin-antitoxin system Phd/YefM family antitoxin [Arthrobacter sp. KN11-1C]|uniref:type II toxin-antitoxin system Phd/YefM family antitoxin n=1 Tax=Arthrobacter sp. KN11-1C TaxID=3445774 RepID=UPI003F9FC6FF